MKNISWRMIVGIVLGLFAGVPGVFAGSLAMPLLEEGAGARAAGMGFAYVGVAQGSSALFWNPAGLSGLRGSEWALHHRSGLGGSIQETTVIGIPMGEWGGFASSLSYVSNGLFNGYDAGGERTGLYSAGDIGGSLGWGKEWLPGFSLGTAVKFNQQNLESQSDSIFAVDFGILWSPLDRLNLGAAYSNLGEKVAESYLTSGLRLGASYNIFFAKDDQFLLAASSELQSGGMSRVNLGGENTLFHFLALLAGYQADLSDQGLTGLTGLTGGVGIKARDFTLNYAFVPYGGLGDTHRLSLTYQFPR